MLYWVGRDGGEGDILKGMASPTPFIFCSCMRNHVFDAMVGHKSKCKALRRKTQKWSEMLGGYSQGHCFIVWLLMRTWRIFLQGGSTRSTCSVAPIWVHLTVLRCKCMTLQPPVAEKGSKQPALLASTDNHWASGGNGEWDCLSRLALGANLGPVLAPKNKTSLGLFHSLLFLLAWRMDFIPSSGGELAVT